MRIKVDTRVYTNCILTVIAVILLLLGLQAYRVSIVSNANAQNTPVIATPMFRVGEHSMDQRTGSQQSGPVPQSEDRAVAGATADVASANRDIAAAIRELAVSVNSVADAIRGNAAGGPHPGVAAPAGSMGPGSGAAPSSGVEVQVGPGK